MTDPLLLLDQYFDGTLSEGDAEQLRNYIKASAENAQRIMLAAHMHANLSELLRGMQTLHDPHPNENGLPTPFFSIDPPAKKPKSIFNLWHNHQRSFAAAAAALLLIAALCLTFFRDAFVTSPSEPAPGVPAVHGATPFLTASIGAAWESPQTSPAAADHFPTPPLHLRKGLALITLPTGTSIVASAPADFSIDSAGQIHLDRGALTSLVSPAGVGFSVTTAACTLTDLGTEFGIYVDRNQLTHAEVFKGKVRITAASPDHTSQILTSGNAIQFLSPGDPLQVAALEPLAFITPEQFLQITAAPGDINAARWSTFSRLLRSDDKTLAYYTFDKPPLLANILPNRAASTNGQFNGLIIGPTWSTGRFPGKQSLRFTGGKSAVHLNIPQPLSAFTLAAWINPENFGTLSQQPSGNRFTALLLSNGVPEGAVHWQIMDGRRLELGLSTSNAIAPGALPTSFQHYWSNYDALSPADLNRWLFIAVVIDPQTHEVRHYCNGNLTGIAPIEFPSTAIIGPAEIGNWDPQSPRADSLRGIRGRIDELALIARPLSDQEIQAMYNAGTP